MTTVDMSKEDIIGVLHAIHNEARGAAYTGRGGVRMSSVIRGHVLEDRLLYALFAIELAELQSRKYREEHAAQQATLKLASSQ